MVLNSANTEKLEVACDYLQNAESNEFWQFEEAKAIIDAYWAEEDITDLPLIY